LGNRKKVVFQHYYANAVTPAMVVVEGDGRGVVVTKNGNAVGLASIPNTGV